MARVTGQAYARVPWLRACFNSLWSAGCEARRTGASWSTWCILALGQAGSLMVLSLPALHAARTQSCITAFATSWFEAGSRKAQLPARARCSRHRIGVAARGLQVTASTAAAAVMPASPAAHRRRPCNAAVVGLYAACGQVRSGAVGPRSQPLAGTGLKTGT
jgi:hypothetical protein